MQEFETESVPQYERNDDGNALHFADAYRDRVTYVPESENWRKWDGKRWAPDSGDGAIFLARELVRSWGGSESALKWRNLCLNAGKLSSMINVARTDPSIRTSIVDFDLDPYLLNTPSGVLDLKNLSLLPHDRKYRLSRITKIGVIPRDPEQDEWHGMPEFKKFIYWAAADDVELVRYFQCIFGLALIGEVPEHILPFFYGEGRNGKGTILNLLLDILGVASGQNYATVVQESFLTSGEKGNGFELASLFGVRLAVHPEVKTNATYNESRLKSLTGGDWITAAYKHKDEFTFKPSHLIIVPGNHRPKPESGGPAFQARYREIPFDNCIKPSEKDGQLGHKLLMEGERILWWIAEGAKRYIDEGRLPECSRVNAQTEDYTQDEDIYQQYLNTRCVEAPGKEIAAETLYKDFKEYCMGQGISNHEIVSNRIFGEELGGKPSPADKTKHIVKRHLGETPITKRRTSKGYRYIGIDLEPTLTM